MRKLRCLLVALAVLTSPAIAVLNAATESASDLYHQGIEREEAGDLQRAISIYERALALSPQNKRYAHALERAKSAAVDSLLERLKATSVVAERYSYLKEATGLIPDSPAANTAMQELEDRRAEMATRVALAIREHDAGVSANCKDVLREAAQWEVVIPEVARLKKAAIAEDYLEIANHVLEEERNPEDALDAVREALKADPGWAAGVSTQQAASKRLFENVMSSLDDLEHESDLSVAITTVAIARIKDAQYTLPSAVDERIRALSPLLQTKAVALLDWANRLLKNGQFRA